MYLDVDILYALLKPGDYHREFANAVVSRPGPKLTSSISLVELAIVARRDLGEPSSVGLPGRLRTAVSRLRILPLSEAHIERADGLRIRYGLGVFDSVHAAVCLSEDLPMASTDKAFARIPGLNVFRLS